MPGGNVINQSLNYREYEIAGNVLRAWYDEEGLAFVVDETIDEYKPNVMLVVRPQGTRRWDDLVQNVYGIDLEIVRPKRDNKYQKLDIEYTGIDFYENLIRAYESNGDVNAALVDLIDFRDAAVRRAATVRLTAAQEEISQANATANKAENSIHGFSVRIRNLRERLVRQKSYVGREPTKQSASRILRTEAQIEAVDEKLARAEKRLENARRRIELATDEVNAALMLLKLQRPSVEIGGNVKSKVMDAKVRKSDVAKMPVTDDVLIQDDEENNEEPQGSEMPDNSEEVKPLLDRDPEILDDNIAFKPVEFDDIKSEVQEEQESPYEPAEDVTETTDELKPVVESDENVEPQQIEEEQRPLSPYAALEDEEPQPTVVHDDGEHEEKPFGFPDEDDSNNGHEGNSDLYAVDNVDDSYKPEESEKEEPEKESAVESEVESEPKIEFEDAYSSVTTPEYSEKPFEEEKVEFDDNYSHQDSEVPQPEETAEEPVLDTIKSVDESVPADTDVTGQVSTEQYDNSDDVAQTRHFSPVEVPKMFKEETRPMSPSYTNENPRPVGGKRSGFAYYILLILLIALSIFTLWLYQKKNGGTVPFLGLNDKRVEQSESFEDEPDVPVFLPDSEEPDVPVVLPPVVEPEPRMVAPAYEDKPIEVRYPNDDIVRGPEPDVPVVESEDDVLMRKVPYGVSRDDIPVFVPEPEPVVETVVVESVVEEPVAEVTNVTAPDVIFEEDVVSVPMPMEGEDFDTMEEYDNPANVEYVSESYVMETPQYVPEPQYAPQPQYVTDDYSYIEERETPKEKRRSLTIHDGGQYSVTETVVYRAN